LRLVLRLVLPLLLMLFGRTGMAQIALAFLAPLAGADLKARISAVGQIAALCNRDVMSGVLQTERQPHYMTLLTLAIPAIFSFLDAFDQVQAKRRYRFLATWLAST
jgi:hypothetical protein